MGWFDDDGDASSDQSNGTSILVMYFDEAKAYPDFHYSTPEEMIAAFNAKLGGQDDVPTMLGNLVRINSASTTLSDAGKRLRDLANSSKGMATIPQIIGAAGGRGDTINWGRAIPEVASQTAVDLAKETAGIAQNVGTGVLDTLKLTKYLPIILLGAGALFLYQNKPWKKFSK